MSSIGPTASKSKSAEKVDMPERPVDSSVDKSEHDVVVFADSGTAQSAPDAGSVDSIAPLEVTDTGPRQPAGLARGAYIIWVADNNGDLIDPPPDPRVRSREPNPASPGAVDIFYGLKDSPSPPPDDQIDLQLNIDKVLRAARVLYMGSEPPQPEKFRPYFVRLFRIAQLGMEGPNVAPGVAKGVLAAIAADLIDDEAGKIKNAYLMRLGKCTVLYSSVCFALYVFLRLFPGEAIGTALRRMQVDPPLLAAFALLWIGCFIGVWLSYGIRKSTFTLVDLTRSEDDLLAPPVRLVFAGLLVTVVGLLFALDLVELRIGQMSLTNLTWNPMLALLIGLFCGISELALPSSIGARAKGFLNSIK